MTGPFFTLLSKRRFPIAVRVLGLDPEVSKLPAEAGRVLISAM